MAATLNGLGNAVWYELWIIWLALLGKPPFQTAASSATSSVDEVFVFLLVTRFNKDTIS